MEEAEAAVPGTKLHVHFSLRFSRNDVTSRKRVEKEKEKHSPLPPPPLAYQIQSEQGARLLDHLLISAFLRWVGWWSASDRLRPRPCSGSGSGGHRHVPLHGTRGRRSRWLLRFLLPDTGRHPYRRLPERPSSSHSPSPPRCLQIILIFIPTILSSFSCNLDIYIFTRTCFSMSTISILL